MTYCWFSERGQLYSNLTFWVAAQEKLVSQQQHFRNIPQRRSSFLKQGSTRIVANSFIAAKWRGTSATEDGVLFHEPDREIRCTTADPLEAHPAVHQSHPGHHTAHDLRKLPLCSHKLLRQQPHSYGTHLLPRLGFNKRGLCLSTRSAHYLIPNQKSKGLCQSVQEVTKIWPDLENSEHTYYPLQPLAPTPSIIGKLSTKCLITLPWHFATSKQLLSIQSTRHQVWSLNHILKKQVKLGFTRACRSIDKLGKKWLKTR